MLHILRPLSVYIIVVIIVTVDSCCCNKQISHVWDDESILNPLKVSSNPNLRQHLLIKSTRRSLLAQRSAANSFCREIRNSGYNMNVFRTF